MPISSALVRAEAENLFIQTRLSVSCWNRIRMWWYGDTGDSYEGICGYFGGTYISYTKEKPISMNPFKVTKEDMTNFGEKKNFLKSLIFLIFKGNELPTKIEDMLVNQTIVEYYDAYFHPFEKFTEKEREGLRQKLLVDAKMEEDYDNYSTRMEDIDELIDRKSLLPRLRRTVC